MQGKDPSELTVRQLLKISKSIKKTGKAESDTEEQERKVKVKDEGSDDSFDESEIVGRVEEVCNLSRFARKLASFQTRIVS